MVTDKTVVLALTLSYESEELLGRCLQLARCAFNGVLERVLIINNSDRGLESIARQHPVRILDAAAGEPIFVRMQRFVEHFLDDTGAHALIKIDPDTVILQWDRRFPDLAGQMLHYHPRHQAMRWPHMPEWWRQENQDFIRPQYLHGIHGGYAWYSREVCRRLRPLFCGYDADWDPATLRTGELKESDDTPCMVGEEHMFAWYMKRALENVEVDKDLDMSRRKYYTYRADPDDIPSARTLAAFHPVKTRNGLHSLLRRVGYRDSECFTA